MRRHVGEKAVVPRGINERNQARQRRVWTREGKRRLVEEWNRSRMSRAEFCRIRGLCYSGFVRWVREAVERSADPMFVEATPPPEATSVAEPSGTKPRRSNAAEGATEGLVAELVTASGLRVRVPREFDADELERLLGLLHRA